VTRQIQRLEQALRLELLDRRQKPPGMTPAGIEVLSRSREILDAYAELFAVGARKEPQGDLRVGIANGLADERTAQVISRVRSRFPRVALRISTNWSRALNEALRRGHLDVAISLTTDAASADSVGQERLTVVTASSLANGAVLGEGIYDLAWILSPEPCDARQRLTAAMAGRPLRIAAEVQDARLQRALVREGIGASIMPLREFNAAPPDGIANVGTPDLDLTLTVEIRRAPHLHALGLAVDQIVAEFRAVATL
jgi:DNA-binding transcriptional LysR family regulator